MDSGFSDEPELRRETLRKFLDGECRTSFVRRMMATGAALVSRLMGA